MIASINTFSEVWEQESEATLSCFKQLTDQSLGKELIGGYRSIERIANHIVDCAASIPQAATLPLVHSKQHYHTVAELTEAYTSASNKVKQAAGQWTDATLQETTPMYGETWKKGFALWVTIAHQAHHRGQLTVLMRMAGLKVPGVYGPAKEEWEAYGLPKAD
ncbi:DinB family protein [Sediminibacterium soli]|uniref:DinB family protein n=1 Tax=Sediminibacterium soli TaxID=2698829 RepID=UPI00137ADCB5|nr:DinB family protein [Sediminibacterium soli]NCI47284.1 hypothetical protein [Sediminibacterium soli]